MCTRWKAGIEGVVRIYNVGMGGIKIKTRPVKPSGWMR